MCWNYGTMNLGHFITSLLHGDFIKYRYTYIPNIFEFAQLVTILNILLFNGQKYGPISKRKVFLKPNN
jgi:prepilin signal peptidase PulO-like enzyme (type II secretory pathway)